MITSSANGKVKQVMNLTKKAKARKESGLFVAEGLRMFKEIPRDRIDSLFVSESFLKNPEGRKLIGPLAFEAVADDVFKTMSDTTTPQGVLALVKQYETTLPLFTEKRLDKWLHNKSLQKAIESYRIDKEKKDYLRSLKVK